VWRHQPAVQRQGKARRLKGNGVFRYDFSWDNLLNYLLQAAGTRCLRNNRETIRLTQNLCNVPQKPYFIQHDYQQQPDKPSSPDKKGPFL